MKDNARVLFSVAILSAVVLTASGTLYITAKGSLNNVINRHPQTFSYVEKGLEQHQVIAPEQVGDILQDHQTVVENYTKIIGIPAPFSDLPGDSQTVIISKREYQNIAESSEQLPRLHIKEGQAVYAHSWNNYGVQKSFKTDIAGQSFSFKVNQYILNNIVQWTNYVGVMIVNNNDYQKLSSLVSASDKVVSYGYELENWKDTQPVLKAIKSQISENQMLYFHSRVKPYLNVKQTSSLTLFIGLFVSILFFIAAGSMIYFKLFTELEDDRQHFRSLQRIGITDSEAKKY